MKEEWKKFVKNKYTVLFAGVLAGILIMIPIVFFLVQNVYLQDRKTTNPEEVESGGKIDRSDPSPTAIPPTSPSPMVPSGGSSNPHPTPSSTPSSHPTEEKHYTEEDVIQYLVDEEKMITDYQGTQVTDGVLSKIKKGFTTVVDFLFYGTTIHGYTFEQLTTTAKLKVLKLALNIDHKIDQYFPGYKETIKEGFSNLKAKAVSLYLSTTAKLCEVVGSDTCTQAREDFQNMKQYLKIDWNLIKGFVSNGTGALKEWYESIR